MVYSDIVTRFLDRITISEDELLNIPFTVKDLEDITQGRFAYPRYPRFEPRYEITPRKRVFKESKKYDEYLKDANIKFKRNPFWDY